MRLGLRVHSRTSLTGSEAVKMMNVKTTVEMYKLAAVIKEVI